MASTEHYADAVVAVPVTIGRYTGDPEEPTPPQAFK